LFIFPHRNASSPSDKPGIAIVSDVVTLLRMPYLSPISLVGLRSRAAVHALFAAMRIDEIGAPSIRAKAISSPCESAHRDYCRFFHLQRSLGDRVYDSFGFGVIDCLTGFHGYPKALPSSESTGAKNCKSRMLTVLQCGLAGNGHRQDEF